MDADFVKTLVQEVKSQGVFDEFRMDSLADVDTKPAYQNVRNRVGTAVKDFLDKQMWTPETNKVQLREKLRKHLLDSDILDKGVDHIVDQVVNPKVATMFEPKIESIVYKYLGIAKPPLPANVPPPRPPLLPAPPLPPMPPYSSHINGGNILKVETTACLLPSDLEQISPDSDKTASKLDFRDIKEDELPPGVDADEPHYDDDTSPSFEPLSEEKTTENVKDDTNNGSLNTSDSVNKELVSDSRDAGASQTSQLSQVSSDSRLTIASVESAVDAQQLASNSVELTPSIAANISEEAQMPKFSENSCEAHGGDSLGRQLHFDIKKDTITFEGTERRNSMSEVAPANGNTTMELSIEDAIMSEIKANISDMNAVTKEGEVEPNNESQKLTDTSKPEGLKSEGTCTEQTQKELFNSGQPKIETSKMDLAKVKPLKIEEPSTPHSGECSYGSFSDAIKESANKVDAENNESPKKIEDGNLNIKDPSASLPLIDPSLVIVEREDNVSKPIESRPSDVLKTEESKPSDISKSAESKSDDISKTVDSTTSPVQSKSDSKSKNKSRNHNDDKSRRKSRDRERDHHNRDKDKSHNKTSSNSKHSSHSSSSKHRSSCKNDKSSSTSSSRSSGVHVSSSSKRVVSSSSHTESSSHKKHKSGSSSSRSDEKSRGHSHSRSHSRSHSHSQHSSSSTSKRSETERERDRDRARDRDRQRQKTSSTSSAVTVSQDDHNEQKLKVHKRKSSDSNDEGKPPGSTSTKSSPKMPSKTVDTTEPIKTSKNSEPSSNETTNGSNNSKSIVVAGNESFKDTMVPAGNVIVVSDILQQSSTSFIELGDGFVSGKTNAEPTSDKETSLSKRLRTTPEKEELPIDKPKIVNEVPKIKKEPTLTEKTTTVGQKSLIDTEQQSTENELAASSSNKKIDDDSTTHFEANADEFKSRLKLIERVIEERHSVMDGLNQNETPTTFEEMKSEHLRRSISKRRHSSERERQTLDQGAVRPNRRAPSAESKVADDGLNPSKRPRHEIAPSDRALSETNVNFKENETIEKLENDELSNQLNSATLSKLCQQQRYTNDDLYKPRPVLSQRSRRRGLDSIL